MTERWIKAAARTGYAARGTVYVLVGGLAVMEAIGYGNGQATDSKGALSLLAGEPGGQTALLVMAAGLLAFAAWRFLQASVDPDRHGRRTKGLVVRGALLVSAVTHLLLAVYAASIPFSLGQSQQGSGSEGAAAWVLAQPFGRYLLGLIAITIIGAGLAQAWKGLSGHYRKRLAMREALMEKLGPVCAFGLIARGGVFAIIGGFFVYAALTINPDEAGGLADALAWMRRQDYGAAMFAAFAIGLVAFGVYCFVEAIWRRIDTGDAEATIASAHRAF